MNNSQSFLMKQPSFEAHVMNRADCSDRSREEVDINFAKNFSSSRGLDLTNSVRLLPTTYTGLWDGMMSLEEILWGVLYIKCLTFKYASIVKIYFFIINKHLTCSKIKFLFNVVLKNIYFRFIKRDYSNLRYPHKKST